MIAKVLPDKWVRKAVFDLVNGIVVDGQTIPVFDYRTGGEYPLRYILMAGQSNVSNETTLCEYRWNHTLAIECHTRFPSGGNPGSRLSVDDIAEAVLSNIQTFQLDPVSGLEIVRYNVRLLTDFYADDGQFVVASKIIQLNCVIN